MKTTRSFTLIELLVVVAIITMVTALVVPAVTGILNGSNLTQAGLALTQQLDLAKQVAITQDRDVEVRFYKCASPGNPGAGVGFRAFQSFVISESGTSTPAGKMTTLPQGMIIDAGTTLSSILNSPPLTYFPSPQTTAIPFVGTNYSYYSIRFLPDGSTNLPLGSSVSANQAWFMTIHSALNGDNLTSPPHDLITVQIDPINGNLKSYRP